MPTRATNQPWQVKAFVDALVDELDSAVEELALKSINRPLTYTVKDVALDLQCFPSWEGSKVRFTSAEPGQTGASRISFQLGSISDRLAREVAKAPPSVEDVTLDAVPLEPEVKQELRRMGLRTDKDLERMQRRNVDLRKATGGRLGYQDLAAMIGQARRGDAPPVVRSAALAPAAEGAELRLRGENLAPLEGAPAYPRARLDGREVPARATGPGEVRVALPREAFGAKVTRALEIALDPYAVLRMTLNS